MHHSESLALISQKEENRMKTLAVTTALLVTAFAANAANAPLTLNVYNPGTKSIFPVTSTLISGEKDAILVDSQFQKNDAEKLVEMIKASGKTLTTIYISQSDPDFYFGLDTLVKHFPQAKVISTPQTAYLIDITKDDKLAIWKPQLKNNAPEKLITPTAITSTFIDLEGQKIEIKQDHNSPEHSYLWIPSLKAIVGGVSVTEGMHLWLADSQSLASRDNWIARLNMMQALSPEVVIPGHYLHHPQDRPFDATNLEFSKKYIQTFNQLEMTAKNSDDLIQSMKSAYPQLAGEETLTMNAKVIMGDMPWKTVEPFPGIGKKMTLTYGDTAFELQIKDNKTLLLMGMRGQFKGHKETVNYSATEVSPHVYLIDWHEAKTGSHIVQVDDFKNNISHATVIKKEGKTSHLKGTFTLSDLK